MITTSNIPPDLLAITRVATEFYINTFVKKRAAKRIQEIKIAFRSVPVDGSVDDYSVAWASYEVDDRGRLPSEFEIIFNSAYMDISIRDYLYTLFHELTHTHQHLTGRLKNVHLKCLWEGVEIDPSQVDYYDHPWEHEAMYMEVIAYAKFNAAFPWLRLDRWKPDIRGRAQSEWRKPTKQELQKVQ